MKISTPISPFALCAVYSRARYIRRARTIRGNTVIMDTQRQFGQLVAAGVTGYFFEAAKYLKILFRSKYDNIRG